ncbi:small integral membrane protein 20 isoform X2 [Polyodon spathula]|uniref:small integral membrane protein 20 isoform X2 n=1 Tax=Polyodon spathula TaxID=7913 RepID=UPI001B7F40C0|nr:small integral membrane protein 20 isoform X2 [Polyodon spathula]
MSRNTRIALIFGGFVTAVGAAFYPIFFHPLTHESEYSAACEQSRNQSSRHPAARC